ncbi:hypothetical protein SLA2020_269210 [Shorea laevis]
MMTTRSGHNALETIHQITSVAYGGGNRSPQEAERSTITASPENSQNPCLGLTNLFPTWLNLTKLLDGPKLVYQYLERAPFRNPTLTQSRPTKMTPLTNRTRVGKDTGTMANRKKKRRDQPTKISDRARSAKWATNPTTLTNPNRMTT